MTKKRQLSFFTVGLAFFSMFFGSGNLVFPLFLGKWAAGDWHWVTIGFLIGGVLAPFLGVMTMVHFRGNTEKFFSLLPKPIAMLFVIILTAVWIPLGAGPRCIEVAYEAFSVYVSVLPLWVFGIIYSILVVLVIMKATRMIEILGYFLTPSLLALLFVIWILGVMNAPTIPPNDLSGGYVAYTGLVYGYSTMDLIASFFFSSTLIHALRQSEPNEKATVKKAFKAGFVGMGVLAIVYIGLIWLSAKNTDLLRPISKGQLLPFISTEFLGRKLGVIPVIAIILACLTTSIAMTSVYAEFLGKNLLRSKEFPCFRACIVSAILSFVLSLLGLDRILFITMPILQISCPLLILLAIVNLIKYRKGVHH